MDLDPSLAEILVCPQCRGELVTDIDADELICSSCKLAYAVRKGIPIMLVDQARSLDGAE
jgi:uncharacterized protein